MSSASSATLRPPLGSSSPDGLYPATIRQLLHAKQPHPQSNFFLDGIRVDRVTCVAGIVNIREYSSMKKYLVEDGTAGRLSVILSWPIKSEIDPLVEEALQSNVFVRVIGRLKAFNGINELQATHIRPVRDMHEPFFHCLEAMAVFVYNQRSLSAPGAQPTSTTPGMLQSPPTPQQPAVETEDEDEDYLSAQGSEPDFDTTLTGIDALTLVDSDSEPELVPQSPPPPESPPLSLSRVPPLETIVPPPLQQDPYSSLSPLQRDIIIQIQENAPHFPNGVPIEVMYRRTGRSTTRESEIRPAIEDMMDDGLIYSTIDENHFKMVD